MVWETPQSPMDVPLDKDPVRTQRSHFLAEHFQTSTGGAGFKLGLKKFAERVM